VTLWECTLQGGDDGTVNYCDLSLVDGYNLPIGTQWIPGPKSPFVPPNTVNAACIATAGHLKSPAKTGVDYSNRSFPIPWEPSMTNEEVLHWCPWDNQAHPPSKPGDGVYPYPDDNIPRPIFNPCLSDCTRYGRDEDCCKGEYNSPEKCKPGLYSNKAKAVCPDAYSYAYNDGTSTFNAPAGGGWEIIFCPSGRSTNIKRTFPDEATALAYGGTIDPKDIASQVSNVSYIEEHSTAWASTAASAHAAPSVGHVLMLIAASLVTVFIGWT